MPDKKEDADQGDQQKKKGNNPDDRSAKQLASLLSPVTGFFDGIGESIYSVFKDRSAAELIVIFTALFLGGRYTIDSVLKSFNPEAAEASHKEAMEKRQKWEAAAKKAWQEAQSIWKNTKAHDAQLADEINAKTIELLGTRHPTLAKLLKRQPAAPAATTIP